MSQIKERFRMRRPHSNGTLFFPSFSKQICLFVYLLLVSRLKGEAANITSDNNSPYPVMFQSCPAPQIKYDVFVSFRGADIRQGFLSHLNEAFSRKQIVAFVDNKLPRGDAISQSLLEAIERSFISLIIFSQNYASSHWCLEELVKIVECRKKDGQIVLPVFYKVDPTDVRHQKEAYGNAFAEHEKNYNLTRVLAWRAALKESADIVGFHSSNFMNDSELVEEIVKCVLMRLNHVHQVNSKGLIGIGKQISHVESLLHLDSKDVRAIGIWGMGGIGKTTIAEEVYNRLHFEYDNCYFIANVREESRRHGIVYLKEKLFATLLREQYLKIDTPHGLPHFVERRLRRMKVLVVIDDVSDPEQIEILIGTLDWFGTGSRVIITTRDKQVLAKKVVDIYEVKELSCEESLQLFNLNAFEQNHLEIEYSDLSKRMVNYAKGVPLVLKVLGHLLLRKDKKIWESQLDRLKKVQNRKVHNVIRLSYNDLDHDEKEIFLDIAWFLNVLRLTVDNIKLLSGYSSVDAQLERLKDKALITISQDNFVSMHSIIQETAWEIVREKSIEDPGNQSRLWDHDDIYQVLSNNKGSEAIKNIAVDLSIIKELQLSPQVFAKMSKLQYLDIYTCIFLKNRRGLNLPQGLQSLPNELMYLTWAYYPLESLPSNFSGENLVVLKLPFSRVTKLWHKEKAKKRFAYLYNKNLPESIKHLTRLTHLDVRHCRELRSLPELPPSLKTLFASDCVSLETVTFPSTAIQQLKENKRNVYFWNCLKLNEHSLKAIGLNAQINIMKYAHQHISTFGDDYDAQGRSTYVYPGSIVPEWLVYRTTHDHMTIDLSSAENSSRLGFIFCFIVPEVTSPSFILRFNISVGEDEVFQGYMSRSSHGIKSDHVFLLYDQCSSCHLNSRAKDQPKLKIKVTASIRTPTSECLQLLSLRGFGVSPINTSQYLTFIQQMELADGPNIPTSLLSVVYISLLPIFIVLFIEFVV